MAVDHGAALKAGVPLAAAGIGTIVFCLLLGDIGISMRERAAIPSATELLRQHATSDTTTSLLLSTVPAALSILLVPLLGYHSDRCRSHLGRRSPFLIWAALAGCLALLGLAASQALASGLHLMLGSWSPGARTCRLALFCLFWTLFECAAISALSLFTGLVNDIVPSRLLGRVFAAFRVLGLGIGIAFNTWIFALTEHYLPEILATLALMFGLPVLAMCLLLRERRFSPHPVRAAPASPRLRFPLVHLVECFSYRPYAWVVAAFVFASLAFTPFNTFYQYYAHATGTPKAVLGALTAAGYSVSILSAFAIGWVADRFGAVRISAIIMAVYCVLTAFGYATISDSASFRTFYLAHVIISGAYFTAAASMPMALLPRARFVQFNSTKDVMVVLGIILVSGVQGPILDLSGHDYRLTVLAGAVFSILCVMSLLRLQSSVLLAQIAQR